MVIYNQQKESKQRKGYKTMMNIQNMPEYAWEYDFVVARECDGDFWFFGAYETEERAYEVALEVGGQVFYR